MAEKIMLLGLLLQGVAIGSFIFAQSVLYLHCYMSLMVLAVPYTFQLSVHKLLI